MVISDAFERMIDNELINQGFEKISDDDARRAISEKLSLDLLYQKQYELTREFLKAHGARSLLDGFANQPS